MGIKDFDDLGKVEQGPGEPINFIHQHDIDLGGANVG
jgi:hypothetical protein